LNIAQCLLTRARIVPSAPAITAGDATLSFGALADRITRMAGTMRGSLGLQRQERVVLCMENRTEFLEALFACWVAGLCVVPVNAKLHAREVAHIIRDSEARAVFTSESLLEGLVEQLAADASAPTLLVAGSQRYESLTLGQKMTCTEVADSEPAWIFYTSGTTGTPKGAVISHSNLLYMALAYYADIERIDNGDTMFHAAPLSHGSGLYSLPHLFAGGHQVILPGFDPDYIFDAFSRYPAVTMFAAPTMVTRMVQAAPGVPDCTGNLRTLFYGGGPMYVSDLLKALDIFGPRFFQLFGQGESPMTITGLSRLDHEGNRDAAHMERLASCGTPRTGVEVRVVDEAGRDLPTGESGEVITRNKTVMSCYWKNEKATAAALRDGWLWTGDIGSLNEFGYLTLRDRSKDMIISGGTNIYPREIEEVLLKHPAVLECSVVGRKHHDWGEEPVAFVVCRAGMQATVDELDALCLEHIARFKRPRIYRFMDALPKNNYGKILKTELRTLCQTENEHA
jgi:long-chain acyl-CoA synthetase